MKTKLRPLQKAPAQGWGGYLATDDTDSTDGFTGRNAFIRAIRAIRGSSSASSGGFCRGFSLLFLLMTLGASASAAKVTIRVSEKGTGFAVVCEVFKNNGAGQLIRLGKTNEKGELAVSDAGKNGEEVSTKCQLYDPGKAECPMKAVTPIEVAPTKIVSVRIAALMLSIGKDEKNGRHLSAAYTCNLAEIESRGANPKLAVEFEFKKTALAARHFGVVNAMQVKEHNGETSITLTEEFTGRLKQFQQENGIERSGKLDTETLNRALKAPKPNIPRN